MERGSRRINLVINYATSAAGSVRVEIQDLSGTPLEGYTLADSIPIYGDEIARIVSWVNGPNVHHLATGKYRPVRLRFVLKDADLFSFRFAFPNEEAPLAAAADNIGTGKAVARLRPLTLVA